jgi:hypothetical protein
MLASPGAKVAAPRLVVADHVARVDATKMITDALAAPVADADVVQLGPDVEELVADLAIQGALDDDELDPREVALALGVLAPAIGDGEPHGAAGLMLDPAQGDSQSDAGGELMLASFQDLQNEATFYASSSSEEEVSSDCVHRSSHLGSSSSMVCGPASCALMKALRRRRSSR